MKLVCEKCKLQSAVTVCSRATATKSPIPGLEGILLEAGDSLKITGYDLKRGIFTFIDADIKEPGSIVMDCKLFGEMVRRMPDGMVTIESNEKLMTNLKCGKTEFNFIGTNAEDYPELPSVDEVKSFEIKQGILKSMINQTIFAISDNDSRPVYTGSMFEIDNGVLTIISVDGFRLAIRRESIGGDEGHYEFIVPGAALSDIERISAADSEEIIKISVGDNHISFSIGETVIVSRRLEGDFLNYHKAIPTGFSSSVKVSRTEFLHAIDRVALVVDEKAKNPVRLSFKEGFIDCFCMTPLGKAEDVCFCEGSGKNLEIGFNGKYLLDAVKAAPSDELLICLNTSSSPCIIMPADENESFKYMILPIRLRA